MNFNFRRCLIVWAMLSCVLCSRAQLNLNIRDTSLCLSNSINVCASGDPHFIPPFVADDIFSDTVDIGFPFSYFGETYTKCLVSPNNFISFDLGFANNQSLFYYGGALNAGQLDKAILFPFQDLDITQGGSIRYMTVGQAPNRRFVVEFCKIPYFFCANSGQVAQNQLILYEGSNVIEMHIKGNSCANGWIGSPHAPAIQGIRNDATDIFVPGRGPNNAPWTISTPEGRRFTPQGSTYQITNVSYAPVPFLLPNSGNYNWYAGNGTTPIATTACANLTVQSSTNYYRVNYTGSVGCDSAFSDLWDTVYLTYSPIFFHDTLRLCANQLPTTWNGVNIPANAVSQNFFDSLTFSVTGSCDSIVYLHLRVDTPLIPAFNIPASLCQGTSIDPLDDTALNGVIGSWSPAFNDQQSTTYTFIPQSGQCSDSAIVSINITPIDTPLFQPFGLVCAGTPVSPLPTTSQNNITGSWTPSFNNAQSGTYTFTPDPGQCAAPVASSVTITPNITPQFAPRNPVCQGSVISPLPTTSINGVTGTWSPALNNAQTTTYTFVPDAGQCATTASMTIVIYTPATVPTFGPVGPVCAGTTFTLPGTSLNGITGSWSPAVNNNSTTTYTFTPANGQCGAAVQMTVQVIPLVIPQFPQVDTLCAGATNFPLSNSSINGVTGSWTPAFNNAATTSYTFTPSAGQCSAPVTVVVPVKSKITPSFTAVAPICAGTVLAPLPTISNNGVVGTWSPAINNSATTTYTFTPASGICAAKRTMTIVVQPLIIPVFATIGRQCEASGIFDDLPTTSLNGITGTWNPSVITPGVSTYTFTPHSGQCAQTISINIQFNNQNTVPTFAAIGPICMGSTNVPALPLVSQNGISGTWSPAAINSSAVGLFSYTFTPSGACGVPTTMQVVVSASIVALFDSIPPVCANTSASPLPTTSNNGVSGVWSPAFNSQQTTTYTFTPAGGQCSAPVSKTVVVQPKLDPNFPAFPAYCQGAALPAMPTSSSNGITGTWSPGLNNTATTAYTFTPTAGQCANTASRTIVINAPSSPVFPPIAPMCSGGTIDPLPTVSNNGFSGSWTPAFNNNVSQTYTFTPNPGQCASATTTSVQIIDNNTIPLFAAVGPVCEQTTLAPLPAISQNGIQGTWSPAINNTQTTTYTFTPLSSQCGTGTTMTIVVDTLVVPVFTPLGPVCAGQSFTLPSTSTNGVSGTWSPAMNDQQTTTYTFTPNAGSCAVSVSMTVVVNNDVTPSFSLNSVVCSGSASSPLPTISNNGITGSWSPANINTQLTTNYTFTPSPGQCAVPYQTTISVDTLIIPSFVQIMPHCVGWPMAVLPGISNQGVTGSWSPAPNNQQTTTYNFTPSTGQCAADTVTMTVEIHPVVTPVFTPVAPICIGESINPLPTISNNGVKGAWSPAINDLATTTYTFTPLLGQCANVVTMTIVVDTLVVPVFTQVPDICSGTLLSPLPGTSTNGVTGTWSPALNNTATTTYMFTATAGQCASDTNMTIHVDPVITPVFTQVAPICQGSPLSPLPNTSNNGVTGTWSPAVMNNTATTTYTFTPGSGNICTLSADMQIIVDPYLTGNLYIEICEGQSYTFGGVSYTQSVTSVNDTFSNSNGCDSIITLDLWVKPRTYGVAPVTICAGSSYMFNGQEYTTNNFTATDTLMNAAGCDSIITLNLTVVPVNPVVTVTALSACGSYSYDGITYYNDTVLTDTLHTVFGCDSIYKHITINVHPTYEEIEVIDTFGCDLVVYDGITYTSSTQLVEHLKSISGCDSFTKYVNIEVHRFRLNASFEPEMPYAGELITVNTSSDVGGDYEILHWEPVPLFADQQAKSQTFSLAEPTSIYVVGESKGCIDTAFIDVGQLPVYSSDFEMPNAFSPNGDGLNDVFKPVFKFDRAYVVQDFRIYNRYGQVMFATSNSAAGWDGTFRDQPADIGVYHYIITIRFTDKTVRTVKGGLTLIR